MSVRVPLTHLEIPENDVEAVLECLRSGWLTMGPRTAEFEERFAEYVDVPFAIAVSSGTAALHLSCIAAGLGPGDEVIVPAMAFVSTPNAVRYTGATPVFCDVCGPHDMNLDLVDLERRITPRTKAVICVNFLGYAAPVVELRRLCEERGLVLISDAAEALGGQVDDTGRSLGTVAHLGAFSLSSKTQLPVGEGGMVVTADEEFAAAVRSLRSHAMTSVTWDRHRGHSDTYDIVGVGYNYRLDEPRAALGLSRLPRLDAEIEVRRERAREYRRRLAGVDGIELVWDDEAVERAAHYAFPVLLPDQPLRDAFRLRMREMGVQTSAYPALHRLIEYATEYGDLSLPEAEAASDRHCVLPISAGLTEEEQEIVVESALRAAEEQLGTAA
jgi:dTDP-4-amino-4,6-dideoxygalactose transaminase